MIEKYFEEMSISDSSEMLSEEESLGAPRKNIQLHEHSFMSIPEKDNYSYFKTCFRITDLPDINETLIARKQPTFYGLVDRVMNFFLETEQFLELNREQRGIVYDYFNNITIASVPFVHGFAFNPKEMSQMKWFWCPCQLENQKLKFKVSIRSVDPFDMKSLTEHVNTFSGRCNNHALIRVFMEKLKSDIENYYHKHVC